MQYDNLTEEEYKSIQLDLEMDKIQEEINFRNQEIQKEIY